MLQHAGGDPLNPTRPMVSQPCGGKAGHSRLRGSPGSKAGVPRGVCPCVRAPQRRLQTPPLWASPPSAHCKVFHSFSFSFFVPN